MSGEYHCYLDWSLTELMIIAIGPKFPCLLSILGSGYIIFNVVSQEQKFELIYHRLMLGMSVSDLLASIAFFIGTWPMPSGTSVDGGPNQSHCYYANVGNATTCAIQGFVIQTFTVAVPIYNAMLCIYFLLFIRYNWSEERLRKVEPLMHGLALIYPLAFAIVCLQQDIFNPVTSFCWISGYPLGCVENADVDCLRGQKTKMFRIMSSVVPIAISLVTILVSMSMLFLFVYQQEMRLQRGNEHSQQVFCQACRYVAVYLFIWTPTSILTTLTTRYNYAGFSGLVTVSMVVPLQGIFNAIIYSKARVSISYFISSFVRAISRLCCREKIADSDSDSDFDDVSETYVGETRYDSTVVVNTPVIGIETPPNDDAGV